MKIVFVMRHPLYVRNYESVIALLAQRGHQIELAFTPLTHKEIDSSLAFALAKAWTNVSLRQLPVRQEVWSIYSDVVRSLRDYLRFLQPRYKDAPRLVERAAKRIPAPIRRVFELVVRLDPSPESRWTDRCLAALLLGVPLDRDSVKYLVDADPDILLVTPLVDMTYTQMEYLRSAEALGLRSVLCVASWDNLTNKGLIQEKPGAVIVWNDIQKREAVELHGMPPGRVRVTGAQLFDPWFELKPSTSRAEFCEQLKLDPGAPLLLYVCSSVFIARKEAEFVRKWLGALRQQKGDLGRAGVVIRPHPANADQWTDPDLSEFANVAVWPRHGEQVTTEEARRRYFDSIYHSEAVIGINTSAFIEAGIVGRPVFTVVTDDFRDTQEGTIHFRYLTDGGLLTVANSMEGHFTQLKKTLGGGDEEQKLRREFIGEFVRPHGIAVPCTPIVADTIEELGREPSTKQRRTELGQRGAIFLWPLAWLVATVARRHKRWRRT